MTSATPHTPQAPLTYDQAGVNYDLIDPLKVAAQRAAAETGAHLASHGFTEILASRGESAYVVDVGPMYLASIVECLGTKTLVADDMAKLTGKSYYDGIAQDTIAMAVNDLITVGATPLVVQAYWAAGGSDWFGDKVRANALVAGWGAYFNYGTRLAAYRAIDDHVYDRVRHFLARRHKTAGRGTKGQSSRTGEGGRLYRQGGNLPFFRRLPFGYVLPGGQTTDRLPLRVEKRGGPPGDKPAFPGSGQDFGAGLRLGRQLQRQFGGFENLGASRMDGPRLDLIDPQSLFVEPAFHPRTQMPADQLGDPP